MKEFRYRDLVTCSPEESAYEAALKMEDNHVGCVIVVGNEKVQGIATRYDFVHNLIVRGLDRHLTKISQIMHTSPITIDFSRTLIDALKLMVEKKVERLLVIKSPNRNGIVGVISLEDVISGLESSQVFKRMSSEKAELIRRKVNRLTPHLLARYTGEERTVVERDMNDEAMALLMLLEESEISLRS